MRMRHGAMFYTRREQTFLCSTIATVCQASALYREKYLLLHNFDIGSCAAPKWSTLVKQIRSYLTSACHWPGGHE